MFVKQTKQKNYTNDNFIAVFREQIQGLTESWGSHHGEQLNFNSIQTKPK